MTDTFIAANGLPSPWTDERVDRLKQLWAKGLSCTQIAFEIGAGLSRNAVMGKVHRLKLPLRSKLIERGKPKKRVRKSRAKPKPQVRPLLGFLESLTSDVPVQPVEATMETGKRASILELKPGECLWPLGEKNFSFCGARQVESYPYCPLHCRMAYRLPEPGRRAA